MTMIFDWEICEILRDLGYPQDVPDCSDDHLPEFGGLQLVIEKEAAYSYEGLSGETVSRPVRYVYNWYEKCDVKSKYTDDWVVCPTETEVMAFFEARKWDISHTQSQPYWWAVDYGGKGITIKTESFFDLIKQICQAERVNV